jgi:hypothetical protein
MDPTSGINKGKHRQEHPLVAFAKSSSSSSSIIDDPIRVTMSDQRA